MLVPPDKVVHVLFFMCINTCTLFLFGERKNLTFALANKSSTERKNIIGCTILTTSFK